MLFLIFHISALCVCMCLCVCTCTYLDLSKHAVVDYTSIKELMDEGNLHRYMYVQFVHTYCM